MREKRLQTKKGTVFYWLSDEWDESKENMFFFPGLTADHTMYEEQFNYFEGKYNLLVWDAPCHGKSRPYDEFSFNDTTDIILQIMNENHIDNIIGVGQSLGGYYIQALIARQPEKVKVFIGIGTTPYGEIYYSKSDIFWLKQVEWMGMCSPINLLKRAAAKGASHTEAGYKNMMKMTAPYKKREYCHLMQVAYNAFLEDNRNLKIPCPVLITYGEYDRVGKVRQYCKMWHEQTHYPIEIIKNAGHNANVDNPEYMNYVIEKFLKEKSPLIKSAIVMLKK